MSNIDNEITLLKSRLEQAQLAKVKAQATREHAEETEAAALERLRTEFGVDTVVQARDRLVELQTDLQTKLSEITSILDEIES